MREAVSDLWFIELICYRNVLYSTRELFPLLCELSEHPQLHLWAPVVWAGTGNVSVKGSVQCSTWASSNGYLLGLLYNSREIRSHGSPWNQIWPEWDLFSAACGVAWVVDSVSSKQEYRTASLEAWWVRFLQPKVRRDEICFIHQRGFNAVLLGVNSKHLLQSMAERSEKDHRLCDCPPENSARGKEFVLST
jgi:hypothetical protein